MFFFWSVTQVYMYLEKENLCSQTGVEPICSDGLPLSCVEVKGKLSSLIIVMSGATEHCG